MRVHATCDHCGREFLLFQLYNAEPATADRCPHCSRHLGVINERSLALGADRAGAQLMRCLNELAARDPKFQLDSETLLGTIRAVTSAAAGVPTLPTRSGEARKEDDHDVRIAA